MTFKTNDALIFTFFALFICLSCENEPVNTNLQNAVETILPNSDLANLMEDMSTVDTFECVDFEYPISFTLYNANFQVLETITIESDGDLIEFLAGLGETNTGVVLASLNFPVTVLYHNGTSAEVNNNQELEAAIMAASDHCGNAEDCDLETIRAFLVSCPQVPTLNGHTPALTAFEFYDSNELFTMFELDLPHTGNWDIAMIEGELHVFINFNGLENFNGEYTVIDCSETTLVLQEGDDILILIKQCNDNTNPFECFGSFDAQITLCDELNDGVEVFDLTQVFANCTPTATYGITYYMSLADAQSGTNQIPNPTAYTNISSPQTIYVRASFEGTVSAEVYEIDLMLDTCDCDNPATLTNDLILYMPFSQEAKDLMSNSTASNVTNTYVADRDGNSTCAIAFDGTNHFSFPVSTQNRLVQGDNFSVSLWFKMQNTDMSNYESLFQKGAIHTEGFQLAVYDLNTPLVSDTTYDYALWDNDWNQEVDVQWENTDWHHLVVTRDSNNTIRLYRDGVLRNVVENSPFDIDTDPLQNYILGEFFEGHLDDLRVYKRTLNPNEVSVLYNLPGDCYQCL